MHDHQRINLEIEGERRGETEIFQKISDGYNGKKILKFKTLGIGEQKLAFKIEKYEVIKQK